MENKSTELAQTPPFCKYLVTSSMECLAQMFNQGTKEKFNKNRREGKKICLVITEVKVK